MLQFDRFVRMFSSPLTGLLYHLCPATCSVIDVESSLLLRVSWCMRRCKRTQTHTDLRCLGGKGLKNALEGDDVADRQRALEGNNGYILLWKGLEELGHVSE